MISAETSTELETQVKNLAAITGSKYGDLENIGVLGGLSGVALFQFYCAQYFDDDTYSETGVEIIERCMEQINNGKSFPTYCNGIAGFGWALQHLVDEDFIDLDVDGLLTPFDDFLKGQMEFEFGNENYDLLHGGMGYGVYFLKRYNSASTSEQNKKKYKGFLIRLVDLLEQMSIKDGDGLKWESVLNIEQGNKGFNLSLSHGMSSIVHVLYKIHQSHIEQERVSDLVKGALNYIGRYEKSSQIGVSLFPAWIDPNETLEYNSRLAWCYGDIGIAKAFEWGAEMLENNDWTEKAKTILIHTTDRKSPESSMVNDAGYCHGSFGNAHMYHQLALRHKEALFETFGTYWLNDGLARNTGDHQEPYIQWHPRNGVFEFELILLGGISGIGLVMLDFLSDKESIWDECLMLR